MDKYEQLNDYTVSGRSIQGTVMDGFAHFTLIASQALMDEGLGKDDGSGVAKFDLDFWYPMKNYVRAIDKIGTQFGEVTLRQLGGAIPKNLDLPPHVNSVDAALGSVDIAYHMNHALNGTSMFSPTTGQMVEGIIGHYGCERVKGKQKFICRVNTVYPCAFDESILLAMAKRFAPTAISKHEPGSCRKTGHSHCVYTITW